MTIRLSTRRLDKLRLLAAQQDKSMTQIIEECIDGLPNPSTGNSSSTNIALLVGQFVIARDSSHTSLAGKCGMNRASS